MHRQRGADDPSRVPEASPIGESSAYNPVVSSTPQSGDIVDEDYYTAYAEGPVAVPTPVRGEGSQPDGAQTDEELQHNADDTNYGNSTDEGGDEGEDASTEPLALPSRSIEPVPPKFHTRACVPLTPTEGAGFDLWPMHKRDLKGKVRLYSRDVTGLSISDYWEVSLCYTPVGRPVTVRDTSLADYRVVGMSGKVVVTRKGARGAGKRHLGPGKDKLQVPSACDGMLEYALPLPYADTYESLLFSKSAQTVRFGRLFAGPDELSVELEGPELLSLEPVFDSLTCSYAFHYGLTAPGRYRIRVSAHRGGYGGLTETHRAYPETSFDSVLGDGAFILAVDPAGQGGSGGVRGDSGAPGVPGSRRVRSLRRRSLPRALGVEEASEPAAAEPSEPLVVDAWSLDSQWARAAHHGGGDGEATLPLCRSYLDPAGRWLASQQPSSLLLSPRSPPLIIPRLTPSRREYLRPWVTDPRRYAWTPYDCRPRPPPSLAATRTCFAGKRVLLSGDSHDRGLFNLLIAHLWRIPATAVLPKKFTGTRCYAVPSGEAPWAVGESAPVPQRMDLDGLPARQDASLARPLPPQLCFVSNHMGEASEWQLIDGRWDAVAFGFGHHPANGQNRWTLDRWRSHVRRVFRAVVSAAVVLDARGRHERDAAASVNDTLHVPRWRAPSLIWHTIPAPPIRKDAQPRQFGDGRTLQRLRAMNAIAAEALDAASGASDEPFVSTLDLWAMTLPLLDLAEDSVHYDGFKPFADAAVSALVGAICGGA